MVIYNMVSVVNTDYRDGIEEIEVTNSMGDNNAGGSFNVRFNNDRGRFSDTFTIGQTITILAEQDVNPPTTTLFVGVIEEINMTGVPNNEFLELSGRDFSARLMDATIEPEVYNSTEASAIITDIVDKYVSNITTTNVNVTSTTIPRRVYLQTNVYDAIKELAEETGFYFFVDTNQDLNFIRRGSTSTTTILNNTNVIKSQVINNNENLFNRVFVYGDRYLTGRRQTFIADGGSVFNLARRPQDTFVTASGLVQSGGVFDILSTAPTGVNYLVDFEGSRIIFVSGTAAGNSIPASGASIIIDYNIDYPIAKFGRNSASIDLYGPYTKIIINNEIKDPRQAADVVRNQLEIYSNPTREISLELRGVFPLTVGNNIQVNLPLESINNESFIILEARYLFNKENNQADQVMNVKLNQRAKIATDTLKQIILDLRRLQASEIQTTQVITRLEDSTGSMLVRVSGWFVRTRTIGNSFILGHGSNGVLGSPAPSIAGGSQVVLGDQRSAFTVQRSGTDI